jgi:hypothetical protein
VRAKPAAPICSEDRPSGWSVLSNADCTLIKAPDWGFDEIMRIQPYRQAVGTASTEISEVDIEAIGYPW